MPRKGIERVDLSAFHGKLRGIDLSENFLVKIEGLEDQTHLRHLNISGNPVASTDHLKSVILQLTELRSLSLDSQTDSRNGVMEIMTWLAKTHTYLGVVNSVLVTIAQHAQVRIPCGSIRKQTSEASENSANEIKSTVTTTKKIVCEYSENDTGLSFQTQTNSLGGSEIVVSNVASPKSSETSANVHDILLRIAGETVDGITVEEASKLIADSPRPLELTFNRIVRSTGEYTIDIVNKPLGLEFEDTGGDASIVVLKTVKVDSKIEGCENLKEGDILSKVGGVEVGRRTSVEVMKQLHEKERPLLLHFKRVATVYQETIIEKHVNAHPGSLGLTFEVSGPAENGKLPKIFVTDILSSSPLFDDVLAGDEFVKLGAVLVAGKTVEEVLSMVESQTQSLELTFCRSEKKETEEEITVTLKNDPIGISLEQAPSVPGKEFTSIIVKELQDKRHVDCNTGDELVCVGSTSTDGMTIAGVLSMIEDTPRPMRLKFKSKSFPVEPETNGSRNKKPRIVLFERYKFR